MDIGILILGCAIGLILMYVTLRPKLRIVKQIDKKTEEQNKQLLQEENLIKKRLEYLKESELLKNTKVNELLAEIQLLEVKGEEIQKKNEILQNRIEKDNEIIYQKNYDLMQEKFSQATDKEIQKFQDAQKHLEEEYVKILNDSAEKTAATIALNHNKIAIVEEQLAILKAKADAAIAAAKREEEMKRNPEDYCIQLDKTTKVDIARMLEFSETLNNPRALLMCIWTSFVRTPLRVLCDNIFGNQEVCGIYRLTINNQFYIGQSVHCKERMVEHFKKALGIDMPTTSKLYSYLNKHNIWDIQIELLEKCKPEELNDKEKFFIELTQANKSLNSNSGNR